MIKYICLIKIFLVGFFFNQSILATVLQTKESNKFVLIISLYNEKDNRRINEYLYCLNKNLHHPCIEKIHVVYDTSNDDEKNQILQYLKKNNSITISYIQGRPTFDFLFDLANTTYKDRKIVISNADIYFDNSLQLLLPYDLTGKFLSLTRWDVRPDRTLKPAFTSLPNKYGYGADTWIFMSPLQKFKNCNFELGTWTCDKLLIYQASKSNLTLLNPCKDIKCCHLHLSGIRHWNLSKCTEGRAWVYAGTLKDTKGNIVIIQEPIRFKDY